MFLLFIPTNLYHSFISYGRLHENERECVFTGLYSESAYRSLCFSPNGHFLVAGERQRVRIWSLRDGSSKTLLDDASTTYSITFSPDGRHIASIDYGAWLRIWDTRTGQLLDTWNGNTQEGLCVAFSPDGKGLVSGGTNGILRYWDVSSLGMEIGRGGVIGGTPGQRFQQIRKFDGHSVRNF
jgi:WD40 repeat protein